MPEPDEGSSSRAAEAVVNGPRDRWPEGAGRLAAVLAARRETLERLRARGVEPFALGFEKDADAADVHREFAGLAPGEETDRVLSVAGRIVLFRRHGRVAFVV